jgi:hypothetical protein
VGVSASAPWVPAPWAGAPAPKRARMETLPAYTHRPLARARSDELLPGAGAAPAWTGLGMPSPVPVQQELMPSIARMGRAGAGEMY